MIRRKVRELLRRRPRVPVRAVAFAGLYATLAIGALSVAVGVTAFVWARVGLFAGVAVGGVFAFAFPATVLYAIHLTNQEDTYESR